MFFTLWGNYTVMFLVKAFCCSEGPVLQSKMGEIHTHGYVSQSGMEYFPLV